MTPPPFVLTDLTWAAVDYMTTHPAQALALDVALLFIAWKLWRLARVRVIQSRNDRLMSARGLHAIAMAQQDMRDRRIFEAAKGRPVSITRS